MRPKPPFCFKSDSKRVAGQCLEFGSNPPFEPDLNQVERDGSFFLGPEIWQKGRMELIHVRKLVNKEDRDSGMGIQFQRGCINQVSGLDPFSEDMGQVA